MANEGSARRLVIGGGTGFVGRALVARLLARGDRVTVLARDATRASRLLPRGADAVTWAPSADGRWQDELASATGVVHLAGEPVAGARWTEARKREIEASRVETTRAIVRAIARTPADARPRVFVCASAVGFYGDRPFDEALDEGSAPGGDFLAGVVRRWEAAAEEATPLGVRVVRARLGVVLGRGGGALEKMLPAFRLGLGGRVGDGKQAMSWIHLDDAVGLLSLALDRDGLAGPMNLTAPTPVSMAEFARALGRAVRRPAVVPMPALALRALFGEGASPLLGGQRVLPKVALREGYVFQFPELDGALADAAST